MIEYKSEDHCDCNICEMTRQTTWVSVKDEKPLIDDKTKLSEHVLVYDNDVGICRGYLYFDSWQHYPLGSFAGDGCLFEVTHWMPLPKPPKE